MLIVFAVVFGEWSTSKSYHPIFISHKTLLFIHSLAATTFSSQPNQPYHPTKHVSLYKWQTFLSLFELVLCIFFSDVYDPFCMCQPVIYVQWAVAKMYRILHLNEHKTVSKILKVPVVVFCLYNQLLRIPTYHIMFISILVSICVVFIVF